VAIQVQVRILSFIAFLFILIKALRKEEKSINSLKILKKKVKNNKNSNLIYNQTNNLKLLHSYSSNLLKN